MTDVERAAALEAIAQEVRTCTRCRLHETRTRAVPGEGNPDTEVVFVGEGPGFNEDREGRPFVGRAGELLTRHLAMIGWDRADVFITNVVKCRPPENRDPEPDEVAACFPYLRRQLEVLDPALVVTLGRHSMARFLPDARISRDHGTVRSVDPGTGARQALVFPMFHPAAALRSPDVARQSEADIQAVPSVLLEARARRAAADGEPVAGATSDAAPAPVPGPGFEPPVQATPDAGTDADVAPEPVLVAAGAIAGDTPALGTPERDVPERGTPEHGSAEPIVTIGADPDPAERDPADQLTLF